MSRGEPFIFTYSSGFGALALQLKQTNENFCSNWASLDWGKREWPPIGTIGEGGVRGVRKNAKVSSRLCSVQLGKKFSLNDEAYCLMLLDTKQMVHSAPITSFCMCNNFFAEERKVP